MKFNLPNLLTLGRLGLIPFFIIAILEDQPARALVIFILSGATDALDGFLARVFGQTSALGAYLDPIADKLLLNTGYVILAIPGTHSGVPVPIWVTVMVLARDVVIIVVALSLSLGLGVKRFPPTMLSKLTTVAQVLGLVLVLLSGLMTRLDLTATIGIYVVAAFTVGSGLHYVHRANRMAAAGSSDS